MLTFLENPRTPAERKAVFAATILENPYIPLEPTVKQATFLTSSKREALYGGSAGGGKSIALLMAALQFAEFPWYRAMLMRKTFSALGLSGALIDVSHSWLAGTGARWNGQDKVWRLPSGATLSFGYLQGKQDYERYQSSAFHFIGFDELTQFPKDDYTYMFSRNRRKEGDSIPLRIRSASNPGGIGHHWVFERFIVGQSLKRAFVPAGLDDNPYIDKAAYLENLEELDDTTKKQLRDGLWVTDPAGKPYRQEWWARGRNRFHIEDEGFLNTILAFYWSWDTANKAKERNAYTVGIAGALLPDYRLLILKVHRDRIEFPALPDTIMRQCEQHRHKLGAVIIEDLASGTPAIQTLQSSSDKWLSEKLVAGVPVGDKIARAQRAAVWCKRGCVLLPHPSPRVPWLREFEAEVFNAPDVTYMDQVDSFSQLIDHLQHILAAGWHARGCPNFDEGENHGTASAN